MSLSNYFRSQADWRRQKAEEYPEDERNVQSADALESLADYVERDERGDCKAGRIIDALEPHLFEEFSFGGEETGREASRYGFGYKTTSPLQHEEFLEELATLCMVDAYQFASEHGVDPSETLLGFEIDAARAGVALPHYYFRRRPRSTEWELEQAVREYGEEQLERR
jgi:hypothetical protein